MYIVHWYTSGGWNYRSTTQCTWDDVQDCRRRAKSMGETVRYEYDYTREVRL